MLVSTDFQELRRLLHSINLMVEQSGVTFSTIVERLDRHLQMETQNILEEPFADFQAFLEFNESLTCEQAKKKLVDSICAQLVQFEAIE